MANQDQLTLIEFTNATETTPAGVFIAGPTLSAGFYAAKAGPEKSGVMGISAHTTVEKAVIASAIKSQLVGGALVHRYKKGSVEEGEAGMALKSILGKCPELIALEDVIQDFETEAAIKADVELNTHTGHVLEILIATRKAIIDTPF